MLADFLFLSGDMVAPSPGLASPGVGVLPSDFLFLSGDTVAPSSSGGGTGPVVTPGLGTGVMLADFLFVSGDMVARGTPVVPPTPAVPCSYTLSDLDGDIEFYVAADPYQKGYGDRGPWRKIRYKVRWGDSDRFMDLLRGGVPSVSGSLILFPTPHRYPGNTNLVCVNAVGTPLGPARPDSKLYAADWCWVDADYEVPSLDPYGQQFQGEFDGETIPWASISERGADEILAASAVDEFGVSRFAYRGLGYGPTTGQVAIPVGGTVVEVRRGMIPADLSQQFLAVLRGLRRTLNNAPFCGYPTGTLMLENWSRDYRFDASGRVNWEYAINLRNRDVDHNMEVVEGTLNQWAFLEDLAGNLRFDYADFTPLKRFGVI